MADDRELVKGQATGFVSHHERKPNQILHKCKAETNVPTNVLFCRLTPHLEICPTVACLGDEVASSKALTRTICGVTTVSNTIRCEFVACLTYPAKGSLNR
jgi:hypothetical protein